MKSWVMAIYLASISAGNGFTAATSAVIAAAHLDVSGAAYYAFFTCVMLASALLFVPVAHCFVEKPYVYAPPPSVSDTPGEPADGGGGGCQCTTSSAAANVDTVPPPSPKQTELAHDGVQAPDRRR